MAKKSRKEELFSLFPDDESKISGIGIVSEILFLENKLPEYREIVESADKESLVLPKTIKATKMYKELLQQYINAVKCLQRITGRNNVQEMSPLREYMQSLKE